MSNADQAEPRKTVLVIDDQAVLLMHVSTVLESEGYVVLTAVDEAEALRHTATLTPDVVLVDIRLDREDGAELISRLRGSSPDSVYVAMSAYTDADSIIRAMQSGAHDYLTKPFSDEDLKLLVDRSYERLRLFREKATMEESLRVSNRELRRMNERLRLMVQTVENIRTGSTREEETRSLLVEFARAMGANGGSLYVREGDELVRLHSLSDGHTADRIPLPPPPRSVLGKAFSSRRPVFVEDIGSDESINGSGWAGYETGSLLSFPLLTARGPVEGIVNLHDPADPPFTRQDLDLGVIFASLVLEAIHTAQAVELLRNNEARFRALIENSTDLIVLLDKYGMIRYASPSVLTVLGNRPEDAVGRRVFRFIHPDDRKSAREVLALSGHAQPRTVVVRVRHRDRSWRLLEVGGTNRLSDPATQGIVLNARDVTVRVEAERRVQESEARYRDIFEHSPAMNVLLSPDQLVLDFNHAVSEALGYTREEAVGKHVGSWLTESSRGLVSEAWPHILGGEMRPGMEFTVVAHDGSELVWYIPPGRRSLLYREGELIGVLLELIDVTDLRDVERREREQREQLYQAAKLVSLGTLLSGVAHEINNPNNFIRISADNLKDFWDDAAKFLTQLDEDGVPVRLGNLPLSRAREMAAKMIDSILDGSDRIQRLVTDLKDFARKSSSDDYVVEDLNKIVRTAIGIVQSSIKRSTAAFTAEFSRHPAPILCNPQQIEQIVMNLITNACNALTAENQPVSIQVRQQAHEPWVDVVVTDEGRGIPESDIHHITDPFFTTRRGDGGTGLGLAVSHRIASDHGGVLEFESRQGHGTTAILRLPSYDAAEQAGRRE